MFASEAAAALFQQEHSVGRYGNAQWGFASAHKPPTHFCVVDRSIHAVGRVGQDVILDLRHYLLERGPV